jgi:competence protein ComEA
MSRAEKKERRVSSPLAACGALLAALALVGLAEGYERSRAPATVDERGQKQERASPPRGEHASSEARRLIEGQRLDLNRATTEELELLPRIGPTLARRIVEDRAERGPFRSVEDLGRVRGIGPRTLEELAPLATVRSEDGTGP